MATGKRQVNKHNKMAKFVAKTRISKEICKMDLAYHGSTSVMQEHLKRRHIGHVDDPPSDSPQEDGLLATLQLKAKTICVYTCMQDSRIKTKRYG